MFWFIIFICTLLFIMALLMTLFNLVSLFNLMSLFLITILIVNFWGTLLFWFMILFRLMVLLFKLVFMTVNLYIISCYTHSGYIIIIIIYSTLYALLCYLIPIWIWQTFLGDDIILTFMILLLYMIKRCPFIFMSFRSET
jgi:hypothetical protein